MKVGLLVVLPVAVFTATLLIFDATIDKDLSIVWFLTSFTMLASVSGMYYLTSREMEVVSRFSEKLRSNVPRVIKDTLRDELQYTSITLENIDQLRNEAARMYERVLKSPDSDSDAKTIYYFGAASLQPTAIELKEIYEKADADEDFNFNVSADPAVRVKERYDAIIRSGSGVIVERHIKMPSAEEFNARSEDYRQRFLSWLKSQRALAEGNGNYVIKRSSRAPEFESFVSFLIGPDVKIEIVGNAKRGGTLMRSAAQSRRAVSDFTGYFEDAAEEINKPKPISGDHVPVFDAYIDKYEILLSSGGSSEPGDLPDPEAMLKDQLDDDA